MYGVTVGTSEKLEKPEGHGRWLRHLNALPSRGFGRRVIAAENTVDGKVPAPRSSCAQKASAHWARISREAIKFWVESDSENHGKKWPVLRGRSDARRVAGRRGTNPPRPEHIQNEGAPQSQRCEPSTESAANLKLPVSRGSRDSRERNWAEGRCMAVMGRTGWRSESGAKDGRKEQ